MLHSTTKTFFVDIWTDILTYILIHATKFFAKMSKASHSVQRGAEYYLDEKLNKQVQIT